MGHGCAKYAVESSIRFVDHCCSRLDVQPAFDLKSRLVKHSTVTLIDNVVSSKLSDARLDSLIVFRSIPKDSVTYVWSMKIVG